MKPSHGTSGSWIAAWIVLVVCATWFATRESAESPTDAAAPVERLATSDSSTEVDDSARDAAPRAAVTVSVPEEAQRNRAGVPVVDVALAVRSAIDGRFLDPARIVWTCPTGTVEPARVARAEGMFEFAAKLSAREWRLHIDAEGFHALDSLYDFGTSQLASEQRFAELLPIGVTLLRARCVDGRSLSEVAQALELDLAGLASSGVWLDSSADGRDASRAPLPIGAFGDSPRFEPVATLANVVDGANTVGILHHGSAPGLWLSLRIGPREHPWRFVERTSAAFVFDVELTLEDFQLSALEFRVVEAGREVPPADTFARLESRNSRLQRPEFNRIELAATGAGTVKSLFPGDYTLIVGAPGCTELRTMIRARAGGRIDLGAFELQPARELEVLVRDVQGHALRARIHVGPFEPDADAEQSYSPRFEPTDERGIARLPPPSSAVVLRATVVGTVGLDALAGVQTRPRLLAPEDFVGRVELVVAEPVLVDVQGRAGPFVVATDEGVLVAASNDTSWSGYLQPGSYRALRRDATGRATTAGAFEVVAGAAQRITLP